MSNTSILKKLIATSPTNKELAIFLLVLKEKSDLFYEEHENVKMDFLMRGICVNEVDGLLEDPSLFPSTWLPRHLRWESILHTKGQQLTILLSEAKQHMDYTNFIEIDPNTAENFIRLIDLTSKK
ncbi:hypothetical protein [Lederbergia lenta]|uniref:Uncharacterized protein n=1 Tax=Lederbergia lenta TaxID=1467 RepID=A0A2X4ZRI7_LEDLE|nr:hypothetical protein [Lederbergia lenta]MCM3112030.1 hypothetical protein [Lederbergia lenta]MEC2323202.1 hypothetical protein [Lederbergia lenta]SQI62974.1 Uncharacterised protein [Lederbergia lenta]